MADDVRTTPSRNCARADAGMMPPPSCLLSTVGALSFARAGLSLLMCATTLGRETGTESNEVAWALDRTRYDVEQARNLLAAKHKAPRDGAEAVARGAPQSDSCGDGQPAGLHELGAGFFDLQLRLEMESRHGRERPEIGA